MATCVITPSAGFVSGSWPTRVRFQVLEKRLGKKRMMTDPISDMLTRIRNGAMARKTTVTMPFSLIKNAIAKILVTEGYVDTAEKVDGAARKELELKLKYEGREPVIRNLKRVSTPGCRVYASYRDIHQVLSGHGIAIVSTSQGVMTDKEARKRKLGGEILCEIF